LRGARGVFLNYFNNLIYQQIDRYYFILKKTYKILTFILKQVKASYMTKRKIIPYNPILKEFARQLRNDSTRTEIFLWLKLKGKQMYGYDFHRQKPIDQYILDFFCQELMLGIEVDGYSHEFLDVYNRDEVKEKRMNELGITILRFSDEQVLKDMENVIRAIEFFIFEYEKHTPNLSL
jgi:very-short-patch-repair endonuclease